MTTDLEKRARQLADEISDKLSSCTWMEEHEEAVAKMFVSFARTFATEALQQCFHVQEWRSADNNVSTHVVTPNRVNNQLGATTADAERSLSEHIAAAIAAAERGEK